MTLISTIIRDAYRESNLIPITSDPSANEIAEGLRVLNRFIASLYGNEVGESLTTIPIGSHNISRPSGFPGYTDQPDGDWFAPLNSRLVLNLTSPQTVYLHPMPQNGSRLEIIDKSGNLATYNLTLNGNGYTIGGTSTAVLSTNNLSKSYFFRDGDWKVVADLATTDDSPFPQEFDDLLIVGVAIRLNPRNGVAVDSQSVAAYKTALRKFRAYYGNTVTEIPVEHGLIRTPGKRIGLRAMANFNTGNEILP